MADAEFQLDKKELTKDLSFPLKGIAGTFIDWVNTRDFNKDGHKDIAQVAPLAIKLMPVLMALWSMVDVNALTEWFLSHDFVKDKDGARALINQGVSAVEEHLAK